jgi:beta-galactosidase
LIKKKMDKHMIDQREIMDLRGEWQLVLDPVCEGLQSGWAEGRFPLDRAEAVSVPGLWNLTYPDYEGIAFYRKIFLTPPGWEVRPCLIHFEGASYRAEVWINGVYVGSHEGAYTPFWFDLTQALRPGKENELVVRIAGLSKTRPVDGMLLKQAPASKQSWYYTHGGLWGTVRLESRPWVSIQAVAVEPHYAGESVRIEATLHNRLSALQETNLEIQVMDPNRKIVNEATTRALTPPGLSRHTFNLPVLRPLPWSYETPHLYQAKVRITSPEGEIDSEQSAFGMRDFTARNGQFFLNGEPVFLRGILLQPHYPVTHVVPPNAEMMRQEIALMKEAGFNLIRCHLRPAPPGYLDITDQMGMMVYAETSLAWIRESPRILFHGEREIQELIQRDRNHPSVVIWGILGENPPASALGSDHFMRCVRSLDATRVVVDNSGSALTFDQDFGWIDRAYVLPDRETTKEKIIDIHTYLGNYISTGMYEWLRSLGSGAPSDEVLKNDFCSPAIMEEFERECRSYRGMIFVSELGGGGMPDLENAVSQFGDRIDLVDSKELLTLRNGLTEGFYERCLDRIFGSVAKMTEASQVLQAGGDTRQIEALLCNPRISGYGLTQLSDAAFEFHAGILDLWRNPKLAYQALKRLNRPDCLILKSASPVVVCGENVTTTITLTRRTARLTGGQVVVEAFDDDRHLIGHMTVTGPAGAGIHELGTLAVESINKPGPYTVTARLIDKGETLAESNETFLALMYPPLEECLSSTAWITQPAGLEGEEAALLSIYPVRNDLPDTGNPIMIAPAPAELSDRQWETMLDSVVHGETAVIGPLHRADRRSLEILLSKGIDIRLEVGIGSWIGCYHWIPNSPLFEGLPNKGFAGEAYIDLLPHYIMRENGGEILAGSLRSKYIVDGATEILWYSDIEAIPFGQGKLVFCQYRCFDKLRKHPIARRLFANLVHSIQDWRKV